MQKKKKRLNLVLLVLYIGILFIYLLTCLIPFLNPSQFWFIAILGLAFPLLLSLVVLCLLITAVMRSRWFFLSVMALLISWQQISALFAFHLPASFQPEKQPNTLRILSWNVSSWTENHYSNDKGEATGLRNLMLDAVQLQNADILCFQEYFESFAPELYPSNIPAIKKMGFPYVYFTPTFEMNNNSIQTGLCIFSRYPLTDTSFLKPEKGSNSEGISMAAIRFNGQTIRIINTHLESPRLRKQEYNPLGEVDESRSVASKIKRAYKMRSLQAELIGHYIDTCRYPVIFCGDFNDVPNSYAYFKAKGKLQDAFLKAGSGIGRTFQFISPTLRIDYILTDPGFRIEQFTRPNYRYSDHYPQVADLSLGQ